MTMAGTSEGSGNYVYGYPARNVPQYVPFPQYVLLPGSPRRVQTRKSCAMWSGVRLLLVALFLVGLATLGYMLFPRQPDIEVRKITLENVNFHLVNKTSLLPAVHLDVSLSLLLKITNSNFFSVVYDRVLVFFSYRGDSLGNVESTGGTVPSRSVVLATAVLDLQGTQLLAHATDLIQDVYNREVPLETVTQFSGAVEMFSLRPHIKMKVYCNMVIEPIDKEVLSKDCSLRPL